VFTEVTCNDDQDGTDCDRQAYLSFEAVANKTYLVQLASYNGEVDDTESYSVQITAQLLT
jgi:hypothetical protein